MSWIVIEWVVVIGSCISAKAYLLQYQLVFKWQRVSPQRAKIIKFRWLLVERISTLGKSNVTIVPILMFHYPELLLLPNIDSQIQDVLVWKRPFEPNRDPLWEALLPGLWSLWLLTVWFSQRVPWNHGEWGPDVVGSLRKNNKHYLVSSTFANLSGYICIYI